MKPVERTVRLFYRLMMTILAPLAFAVPLCRGLRDRRHWIGLRERFGWGPYAAGPPGIWLHAVSLGEVGAAAVLVRALRTRHPDIPVVLSTATLTGRMRAQALFAGEIDIRYLPYDTPRSVARFLARTKSRLLAISLEDLLRIIDQPNIPGTVHEHPNWRQRIAVSLEQIASAIDVDALRAATHERSSAAADR